VWYVVVQKRPFALVRIRFPWPCFSVPCSSLVLTFSPVCPTTKMLSRELLKQQQEVTSHSTINTAAAAASSRRETIAVVGSAVDRIMGSRDLSSAVRTEWGKTRRVHPFDEETTNNGTRGEDPCGYEGGAILYNIIQLYYEYHLDYYRDPKRMIMVLMRVEEGVFAVLDEDDKE